MFVLLPGSLLVLNGQRRMLLLQLPVYPKEITHSFAKASGLNILCIQCSKRPKNGLSLALSCPSAVFNILIVRTWFLVLEDYEEEFILIMSWFGGEMNGAYRASSIKPSRYRYPIWTTTSFLIRTVIIPFWLIPLEQTEKKKRKIQGLLGAVGLERGLRGQQGGLGRCVIVGVPSQ